MAYPTNGGLAGYYTTNSLSIKEGPGSYPGLEILENLAILTNLNFDMGGYIESVEFYSELTGEGVGIRIIKEDRPYVLSDMSLEDFLISTWYNIPLSKKEHVIAGSLN